MIDSLKEQLKANGEILLRVKVRPQAQSNRFRGPLGEDTYKVDVAAAPEDGKANEALIRFLSGEFDVPQSHIEILSGETGRLKTIRMRA